MIDDVAYVREDSLKQPTPMSDQNVVVVRTRSAGVHVGELVSQEGTNVVLKNATRVWRWRGANTLSELSVYGADTGYTRISEPVIEIRLTEAIEVIPCTSKASSNLRTPRWPA